MIAKILGNCTFWVTGDWSSNGKNGGENRLNLRPNIISCHSPTIDNGPGRGNAEVSEGQTDHLKEDLTQKRLFEIH